MSARIVVLGQNGLALEIDSPSAGALVNGGAWVISLTKYAGPLTEATVIVPKNRRPVPALLWQSLKAETRGREFPIDGPIPLGPPVADAPPLRLDYLERRIAIAQQECAWVLRNALAGHLTLDGVATALGRVQAALNGTHPTLTGLVA